MKNINLRWTFVLIWIFLIFYLSSKNANISAQQSGIVVEIINKIAGLIGMERLTNLDMQFFVRKSAHILNYFILSILVIWSIMFYRISSVIVIIYSLLISNFISLSDEFFQRFIPGRAGQIKDVMIDNIGIMMAICLVTLMKLRGNKKQRIL